MPRKYDQTGRDMLANLCNGRGADIGCNVQKITPNCIGVDNDESINPDIVADMGRLPLGDCELDFVVAAHCLEHAPDTVATLKEWGRVIRKGGNIGVIVPHGEYANSETLGDSNNTHCQLFTPKTLKIYFEHSGFTGVEVVEYPRPYAWHKHPGIFAKGIKK